MILLAASGSRHPAEFEIAVAAHELDRRKFTEEHRLANVTIALTKVAVLLSVVTLIMVGVQTCTAIEQNKIFKSEVLAAPDLDVKFVKHRKIDPRTHAYELRVENSGDRSADGAYLHLFIPRGVTMKQLPQPGMALSVTIPEIEDFYNHYELQLQEKILRKRNAVLGDVTFFIEGDQAHYEIGYLVASDKMGDRKGSFTIRKDE